MRSPRPSSSSALDAVSHSAPLCSFNHRVTACALAILLHVFRMVSHTPTKDGTFPHSPANSIRPAHAISGRSFLSRASSNPSIPMAPHPHFGLQMASEIISCRFWQIRRQFLCCLGESHQDLLKASLSLELLPTMLDQPYVLSQAPSPASTAPSAFSFWLPVPVVV